MLYFHDCLAIKALNFQFKKLQLIAGLVPGYVIKHI